jgi:uncharacterized protein
MTARRIAGVAVGVVFGFVLCWSAMVDPDVIRGALLLEQSYLFLFFGSAVAVAAVGVELLRRAQTRTLLTGRPIDWPRERPQRRHVVGSIVFGVGWGVSNACPGPVAAQLGQGMAWSLPILAGIAIGVWLFQRGGARETEPAADRSAPSAARPPGVVAEL